MKPLAILVALASTSALAQTTLCETENVHTENGYYFQNLRFPGAGRFDNYCLKINSVESSGVSWQQYWEYPDGSQWYAAYHHVGRVLGDAKLVSEIQGIPASIDWAYDPNWRATSAVGYELYTSADAQEDRHSGDYQLKIILGGVSVPQTSGESAGTVQVDGAEWELFQSSSDGTKLYEFVARDHALNREVDSDLKAFFDHLASNNDYPADDQYLTTLNFGTWAAYYAGTINFNHYSVDVN